MTENIVSNVQCSDHLPPLPDLVPPGHDQWCMLSCARQWPSHCHCVSLILDSKLEVGEGNTNRRSPFC